MGISGPLLDRSCITFNQNRAAMLLLGRPKLLAGVDATSGPSLVHLSSIRMNEAYARKVLLELEALDPEHPNVFLHRTVF